MDQIGLYLALFAPLVFTQLPMETAARFIRATFPRHHLFILILATLGVVGLALAGRAPHLAPIAAAIALAAAHARWILTLKINALRDAELAGDAAARRPRLQAPAPDQRVRQRRPALLAGYLLAWLV